MGYKREEGGGGAAEGGETLRGVIEETLMKGQAKLEETGAGGIQKVVNGSSCQYSRENYSFRKGLSARGGGVGLGYKKAAIVHSGPAERERAGKEVP